MWLNNISNNYNRDSKSKKKNNGKDYKKESNNDRYNIIGNNFTLQKNSGKGFNNDGNNKDNADFLVNDIKNNKIKKNLSRSWDSIYSSHEIKPMNDMVFPDFNSFSLNNLMPKGLNNIGATCYMNATLQCFYHCSKLTKYLVSNKYIKDNIQIKNNTISYEYINLVKELYSKDGKGAYSPYKFKEILGRENSLFSGIAANDSKDLILFLEQVLAKELALPEINNCSNKKSMYQEIDQTNEQNTLNFFLEDFTHERSIIKDIFYFICKTKSVCQACKTNIFNFQVSNFLIFPLEKTYKDSMALSIQNNNYFGNNLNNENMMMTNLINNMMNNMMNMNTMIMNNNNFNYINNLNNRNNMNNNYYNNSNNNFSNIFFNNFHFNNNNYKNSNINNLNNGLFNEHNNNYNNNFNINNLNNNIFNNNNFNTKLLNDNYKYNRNISQDSKNIYNKNKLIDTDNKYIQEKKINNKNLSKKKLNIKTKRVSANDINKLMFNNNKNINNNQNQKNNYSNNNYPFFLGSGPNDYSLSNNKKTKPKITLAQCFESYLQPEFLTRDNKQYCNKCHQLRDSFYYTSIYTSSNILILILNYGKGILFECDVDFDEVIDISKYVEKKESSPVKYRLLGLIVHFGPSSMNGHFIACCRGLEDKNQWYKLNDGLVSKTTFSEIKTIGMPYVLFYENNSPY